MELTPKQLELRWRKQIYYNRRLGHFRMNRILSKAFTGGVENYTCDICSQKASFAKKHVCPPEEEPEETLTLLEGAS